MLKDIDQDPKSVCKYIAFSDDGKCLLGKKCICEENRRVFASKKPAKSKSISDKTTRYLVNNMQTLKKILIAFGIVWGLGCFFLMAYVDSSNPDATIEHSAWELWLPEVVFCLGAMVEAIGWIVIAIHER